MISFKTFPTLDNATNIYLQRLLMIAWTVTSILEANGFST